MNVNLKTLDGITAVREDVLGKMLAGEMAETKAVAAEKILRGAQAMQGDLRVKFLGMIIGNKKFDAFAADLAQSITQFVNGPAALTAGR